MKFKLKTILLTLLAVLVIIQFFHPARNLSNDNTNHVSKKYPLPDTVAATLKSACYDCHSNLSEYPWYFKIQPADWWLTSHINGGKQHLNFSEFTSAKVAVQNHKFEEIIKEVKEGEMPISSYTWFGLHAEARLTDPQRALITAWAQSCMDTLKMQYPPDSLVLKRRNREAEDED